MSIVSGVSWFPPARPPAAPPGGLPGERAKWARRTCAARAGHQLHVSGQAVVCWPAHCQALRACLFLLLVWWRGALAPHVLATSSMFLARPLCAGVFQSARKRVHGVLPPRPPSGAARAGARQPPLPIRPPPGGGSPRGQKPGFTFPALKRRETQRTPFCGLFPHVLLAFGLACRFCFPASAPNSAQFWHQ